MLRLAVICSANMCRSPMAQAIFAAEAERRGLALEILSAGIWDFGAAIAVDEAQAVCERNGTPLIKLLSTCYTEIDLSTCRRVFVMEHRHVTALLTGTEVQPEQIVLIGELDPAGRGPEIEDPIGCDADAFDRCYRRLRDCIVHYFDTTTDFARS